MSDYRDTVVAGPGARRLADGVHGGVVSEVGDHGGLFLCGEHPRVSGGNVWVSSWYPRGGVMLVSGGGVSRRSILSAACWGGCRARRARP